MSDKGRVCWVVTGAGHFLRESAEIIEAIADSVPVDLFFTRAAREVVARYNLRERLERAAGKLLTEGDYSSYQSVYFSSGRYRVLVISPATANTVAKCALGIADSLASNFFAQAGKSGVPIVVLPTDTEKEIVSITPSGKDVKILPRPVDLRRTAELADESNFPGVSVALSVDQLRLLLAPLIPALRAEG